MTLSRRKRPASTRSRIIKAKPGRPKPLKDGSVPEKVIQYQILRWLENTDLLHWRANSGVVFVHGRRISLGPDGISDVVIVVPPTGRFLGLEIKSAKGCLRPVQRAFQGRVEAMGAHYRVVRSLKEAQDAVAEIVGEEKWKQLQLSGSARELSVSGSVTCRQQN